MTNPVEEVIIAEKEAEKVLKKAEEHKLQIIANAKREMLTLLTERQKKADMEQEAAVKKKTEELERKKEKIRANGRSKISQVERGAQENVSKAVEFILKEFEQRLD